jgi:hypothetical protein
MPKNAPKPTTSEIVGGTYNATPDVLEDGQADSLQLDVNGNLKVTVGGGAPGAPLNVNIADVNGTPPALTNPLPVELSDGTNQVGTPGNPLSVNVISGGGSNASVGVNALPAPTSSTEIGSIDAGGNLQGASITTPIPVELSNGIQQIGTFSSPLYTFDIVNGTVGQEAGGLIVPIGGMKGSAYAPVLIDSNGAVEVSATLTNGINVIGTPSNPLQTMDATPGTKFIFQEILAELRAVRKILMVVYEESGEGNISSDLMDDVNIPTNVDYN